MFRLCSALWIEWVLHCLMASLRFDGIIHGEAFAKSSINIIALYLFVRGVRKICLHSIRHQSIFFIIILIPIILHPFGAGC